VLFRGQSIFLQQSARFKGLSQGGQAVSNKLQKHVSELVEL
jgi:hypothetical protein